MNDTDAREVDREPGTSLVPDGGQIRYFAEELSWRFDDIEAMECPDCGHYGINLRELLPAGWETCNECGAEFSVTVYREDVMEVSQ